VLDRSISGPDLFLSSPFHRLLAVERAGSAKSSGSDTKGPEGVHPSRVSVLGPTVRGG
jgi:hypothetical protein